MPSFLQYAKQELHEVVGVLKDIREELTLTSVYLCAGPESFELDRSHLLVSFSEFVQDYKDETKVFVWAPSTSIHLLFPPSFRRLVHLLLCAHYRHQTKAEKKEEKMDATKGHSIIRIPQVAPVIDRQEIIAFRLLDLPKNLLLLVVTWLPFDTAEPPS